MTHGPVPVRGPGVGERCNKGLEIVNMQYFLIMPKSHKNSENKKTTVHRDEGSHHIIWTEETRTTNMSAKPTRQCGLFFFLFLDSLKDGLHLWINGGRSSKEENNHMHGNKCTQHTNEESTKFDTQNTFLTVTDHV